jgi:hypothetical protein
LKTCGHFSNAAAGFGEEVGAGFQPAQDVGVDAGFRRLKNGGHCKAPSFKAPWVKAPSVKTEPTE